MEAPAAALRPAVLAAALALSFPVPGSVPAAAGEEEDGLPTLLAALRPGVLARLGRASFRHSEADLGSPADAFDGRPGTVLRSRAVNPAFLEVAFDVPREVLSAQAFFPGGAPHEWSLLAGGDPERLAVIFERRRVAPDAWSPVVEFHPPLQARIFRVVVRRLAGDDFVHFGEISLQARQRPVSLEMLAPSTVVAPEGDLVLGARATFDGGVRSASVHGLGFEAPADAPFRVETIGRNGPVRTSLRYERTGRARIRARVRRGDGWLVSEPLEIEAREEGLPDWSAGWIERTPRLPFDGPGGGRPAPGSAVVWRAHVRNYGTRAAPRVPCLWTLDGRTVGTGSLPGIPRFAEETATLRLEEDGRGRDLRFVVDPSGEVPETSEGNNAVTVRTDALLLGLWVERPVVDWFPRVQASFGDGANGWEDWAQRQVARWNRMLAEARHPLTPEGVTDRVALDLVVVAEEGALPLGGGLPSNDPDASDRTVDLQWGFPATLLDGDFYRRVGERSDANPLWFEGSLLHELGHARYLVDLYRLNVHAHEVDLRAPDGTPVAGSPLLPVVAADALRYTASGRMMAGDYAGGYGPHEAYALQRVAGRRARGGNRNAPPGIGEYLADLPRTCGVRVLAADGQPLDGVRIRAWRRAEGPGGRERFGGDPVREGETAAGGAADLSPGGRDPFFEGRKDGSFDAGQGVLLLQLSREGRTAYRFLEVVPFNLAFWGGERAAHFEDVPTDLPR